MSLEDKLNEVTTNIFPTLPEPIQDKINDGISNILQMEIEKSILKVGEKAPTFSLTNADGKKVELRELLTHGFVLLTFYRGIWCPYCQTQLRAYQEILPEIHKAGGNLVAVSPQLPDYSLTVKEDWSLDYEVLSDLKSQVAGKFGICYDVPDSHISVLEMSGFPIDKNNGDDKGILPIPASFLIDQDRIIRWRFVDNDYRNRAEPEDILRALKFLDNASK